MTYFILGELLRIMTIRIKNNSHSVRFCISNDQSFPSISKMHTLTNIRMKSGRWRCERFKNISRT